MANERTTHLLIDGENLDATLGNSVLGNRRPNPDERPRWDAVRDFAQRHWGAPVNPLFFLNASSGSMPETFVQALLAMRYRVIPLSGGEGEKVVDRAIIMTLEALRDRPGNVLLASHDRDFADDLHALLGPDRRVGVIGFREYVSQAYRDDERIEILDLEDDAQAFMVPLPRMRIIPIDEFDPTRFL